jgi:hypothetical protein
MKKLGLDLENHPRRREALLRLLANLEPVKIDPELVGRIEDV